MRLTSFALIAILMSAALAQNISTTAPRVIRFSGQVAGASEEPQTVAITFAIYSDPAGGSSLWSETQPLTLDHGKFTALLGSTQTDGLPISIFAAGAARWIEWQIVGQPPATRVPLVSVPYALSAANAETLAGHSISDFVLAAAPQPKTASESSKMQREGQPVQSASAEPANMLAKFNGASTISSQVYDDGVSVGVGTIAPSAKLEVAGDLKISGDGNALVFPDGTRFSANAASGFSAKNIEQVRYADQFAAGSQTGGITEAYADCPATGCKVQLGADITITSPQVITVSINKPLVLDLAGRTIKVSNAAGTGLTFTSQNINARTPLTVANGTLTCAWSAPNLVGFAWHASVNVSLDNLDVRNCNTPGSVAVLWDFVEDAHMNAVGFRFNSGALRVQNASNQVSFHNVWFDSNVDPIIFQDNSGITLEDCLVQSNTGRRAVQMLTSMGNNATTLRVHKCHFENNGDGTAASRNIYVAPSLSQVVIGVSVEDNVFTAGAYGAAGTSFEVGGSQVVAPLTFKNNQYNGYSKGKIVTGIQNGSRVTSIAENLAPGDSGYDVGINTHGINGLSFAPEGAKRAFQIFAGWPNQFDGQLQFWDTTGNASILSYSSASSSWVFPRTAVFGSALVVDNSQSIFGYSDHQQTQTWGVNSANGAARFDGGAKLGSAGLTINGAAALTTTAQTGAGSLVMSNGASLTNPNIGNATASSITINNESISAAPRMVYSAFITNPSVAGLQSRFTTDKAIVVTRFQFVINSGVNANCTTAAVLQLTDGVAQLSLPLANNQTVLDSGSVTIAFPAGANLDIKIASGSTGCSSTANSGNATVQYRMQ